MPLLMIVTPGHPMDGRLRQALADMGCPYEIEVWSFRGPGCPVCATVGGLGNDPASPPFFCRRCFKGVWVRQMDNGAWASSTDNYKERKLDGQ